MKGVQGLVIAGALGIVGALCNWLYVSRKAADLEKEAFIYVKAEARIRPGDILKEEHFGKVEIPRKYVGNLRNVAFQWEELRTVIGYPALRAYPTDQILLREDIRTPPRKKLSEQLGPDEVAQAVMVNPTTFVSENYNPGEYVYFGPPINVRGIGKIQKAAGELVGPFRILRIGSRAGSADVYRVRGLRSSRSNVLVVPLVRKNGQYDRKAKELLDLIQQSGGQGLEVYTESAQRAQEKAGS